MTLRRAATTMSGVLVALLATTLTPAYAGTNTHLDATGEVVSSAPSSPTLQPAPHQARGDIRSIRVSYDRTAVRVLLGYRALDASGQGADFDFALRTASQIRFVSIRTAPRHWSGRRSVVDARQRPVACRGALHRISYARNTVQLTVPRSCLGNAAWVRVAAYSFVYENGRAYLDDARTAGYGRAIVYGPRVYR